MMILFCNNNLFLTRIKIKQGPKGRDGFDGRDGDKGAKGEPGYRGDPGSPGKIINWTYHT